jgi:carbamoyltransferase
MTTSGNGSPCYVLGVNPGPHDASAALLRDGELVAMIEQERLCRKRHAIHESPREAIAACLRQEGIDLGAISEIAVGWDVPKLMEIEGAGDFEEREFRAWLLGDIQTPGNPPAPLRFVEHHVAHAASAFYTSGMKEAAILVLDGRGEDVATTLAVGGPGGIEIVETWGAHLSLGHLYGSASDWAGLSGWGAGKLMGLAAYGQASQPVPLAPSTDGYTIAGAPSAKAPTASLLSSLAARLWAGFSKQNYPFCQGDPDDVMAYADFAASIQLALEEVILNLAAIARRESGSSNLVMAGGVALNCTANGALVRSGIFDQVWVPPVPHDAGVSLGGALVADRAVRGAPGTPSRLPHAFWSPDLDRPDGSAVAGLSGCEVTQCDEAQLADVVAQQLEAGWLVGWWQGRAEVGQRALGARSILCDPRRRQTLLRANRVKGREAWRPLAPAVLAEHAGSVFDGPLPPLADFMLAAWPVRKQASRRLPAAVHVDGSARPQVVREEQGRYHGVIRSFHERTGVPAVINTSFNLAGEPIVLSARDAVETFLRSELDVLVLDDLVAVKPAAKAPGPGAPERSAPDGALPTALRASPWMEAHPS